MTLLLRVCPLRSIALDRQPPGRATKPRSIRPPVSKACVSGSPRTPWDTCFRHKWGIKPIISIHFPGMTRTMISSSFRWCRSPQAPCWRPGSTPCRRPCSSRRRWRSTGSTRSCITRERSSDGAWKHALRNRWTSRNDSNPWGHHWIGAVVILMKFSSPAAPDVDVLTTSSVTSYENFVQMTSHIGLNVCNSQSENSR